MKSMKSMKKKKKRIMMSMKYEGEEYEEDECESVNVCSPRAGPILFLMRISRVGSRGSGGNYIRQEGV